MFKIPANQLHDFSYKIFKCIGCNDEEANLASDVLILADLRGVDSHGLARLSGYIRLYEKDRLNPKPNIRIIHETPSTCLLYTSDAADDEYNV